MAKIYKNQKTTICINSLLTGGTSTLHILSSSVDICSKTVRNTERQGSTIGKWRIEINKKQRKTLNCFRLKKSIEVHVNRSKIFLLYFYDAYDVIREKKISEEVLFIHAGQMSFFQMNFIVFWKKE